MATQEEEDAFIEGFDDIPSHSELSTMSFVKLASLLSLSKLGSAKFLVIENALLRHKEAAQTKAAKFGAITGALAALTGAIVGAILTAILSSQQPSTIIHCQFGNEGKPTQDSAAKSLKYVPAVKRDRPTAPTVP